MTTKFTPLHDRILVRRVEEAATTRGGLIIPDSAKDKPQEGKVISAGKRQDQRGGQIVPTRGEGRRRHPIRQVLRHRNQT
jgi:chaperonin GroES